MIKLDKYFVEDYFGEQLYTAGVVRKDNEAFLIKEGFRLLRFTNHINGSVIIKLQRFFNAVSLALRPGKKSIVLFHFPLNARIYLLLQRLLKWRGISTIALLIDIDGSRDNDAHLLQSEIGTLKKFDCLIVHNKAMQNFVQQHIPNIPAIPIEIFDYPFTGTIQEKIFSKKICIAANFNKAKFVYELHTLNTIQFFLYGKGYDEGGQILSDNIFYKGVVAPSTLPNIIEGSFGLVWDGDSINDCDPYLRINNPHKLSLYLAAGMPVIVWEQSAMAVFVKAEGVGIIVNSLQELDSKLNLISSATYFQMQQNTIKIGNKLRTGFYLKEAINKAIFILEQQHN